MSYDGAHSSLRTPSGGPSSYGSLEPTKLDPRTGKPEAKKMPGFVQRVKLSAADFCANLPDFLHPWITFTMVVVPFALFQVAALGWLALIYCYVAAACFLVLSKGRAWFTMAIVLCGTPFLGYIAGNLIFLEYRHAMGVYDRSRDYTNVLPDEDPGAKKDAGYITFSADASVDFTRGAGYRQGGRYCAAPIVGQRSQTTVGYWAVGVDCCSARGDFWCGDSKAQAAGEPPSNGNYSSGGIVVLDANPLGTSEGPLYMKAVTMAAAAYELQLPIDEEPTLVLWGTDIDMFKHTGWHDALSIFFATVLGALGVAISAACLLPCAGAWLIAPRRELERGTQSLLPHPEEAHKMWFGFGLTASKVDDFFEQVIPDLVQGRCYWSGEINHDYVFYVANNHLYLGCIGCHPYHPYYKLQRLLVMACVTLLIMFPVGWIDELVGDGGFVRILMILLVVAITQFLARLYFSKAMEEVDRIRYTASAEEKERRLRRSVVLEGVALAVCILLAVGLTVLAALEAPQGDDTLGMFLQTSAEGIGWAWVFALILGLLVPSTVGPDALGPKTTCVGFIGRWRRERDARGLQVLKESLA